MGFVSKRARKRNKKSAGRSHTAATPSDPAPVEAQSRRSSWLWLAAVLATMVVVAAIVSFSSPNAAVETASAASGGEAGGGQDVSAESRPSRVSSRVTEQTAARDPGTDSVPEPDGGGSVSASDSLESTAAPVVQPESHRQMVAELRDIVARTDRENFWLGDLEARVKRKRNDTLGPDAETGERWRSQLELGLAELRLGNEVEALEQLGSAYALLDELGDELPDLWRRITVFEYGLAHMRRGETLNCSTRHTGESCIMPIRGSGVHEDPSGSKRAIELFEEVLEISEPGSTMALKARWLMNIAYMTLGQYPSKVPKPHLIEPEVFGSEQPFQEFENVAPQLGVDSFNLYGGAVVDDFTGDGYLDILTTTFDIDDRPHLFRNERSGTFVDVAEESRLGDLYGGINVIQADYDNDGDLDFFILRGAWLRNVGKHPNSLVRNNGDGTFSDVTLEAGMTHRYPTQTGAWADFDNDGFVDLFVGNESNAAIEAPSQLYRNNGDGTFTDVAAEAGVETRAFVKGSVWGDYDADGWPDLYVSVMGGANRLYRNRGADERGQVRFEDVASGLGVEQPHDSFPVWFWDYDNDGHLDLYVPSYKGDKDAVAAVAASYLGYETGFDLTRLYRGDGQGGFSNVAASAGLERLALPMGANFGDLDNDGYLDIYLGTGYPDFEALTPNVMYRNVAGSHFVDVSYQGRFGHLQKGHSVAFGDLDNDGDLDIFEQMGGIFPGDRFGDALFENPGFGNRFVAFDLVGVQSNRAALGARIRVSLRVDTGRSERYRWVTSGGSFGSSSLRQVIGLGGAEAIESVEIFWPASGITQTFDDVPMNRYLRVVEGEATLSELDLERLEL